MMDIVYTDVKLKSNNFDAPKWKPLRWRIKSEK